MTEESLCQSLLEAELGGGSEMSQNESRNTNETEPRSGNKMAVLKPQRKPRTLWTSRKPSSVQEDQIEERLHLNLESRFSSFEENKLSVLADFSKQKGQSEMADSRPRTVSSVTVSEGKTSCVGHILNIQGEDCPEYLL